jgi:hypothetical protein
MNPRFLAIAQDPSIIHGVHHYCDEWCSYCAVTDRCLGFRCTEAFRTQRRRRAADPTFTSMEEAIAFTREVCALDGSSTEELDAIAANPRGRSGLQTTDSLAGVAWDYAVRAAFLFTEQAMTIVTEPPRDTGPVPVEVVMWHHLRIYMKLVRALVSGERSNGGDRLAEDANGCARLVLVSVDRSRIALASLRAEGCAAEVDGLLTSLDALTRGIEQRFPQARAYVRYGLDCPVA